MAIKKTQCIILATLILSGITEVNAQIYTFTDLGSGVARAINNFDQIAGDSADGNGLQSATIWNKGIKTNLGAGFSSSSATSINDSGQVVGTAYREIKFSPTQQNPTGVIRSSAAMLWNGSAVTNLGAGVSNSFATGINNAGQVVGTVSANGYFDKATLWNGVIKTDLGGPSWSSYANAINSSGQIAGYYSSGGASVWDGLTLTNLAGPGSAATAINNLGQVVGYNSESIATIWNGTIATTLGTIPSYATAINNSGKVVGYSSSHLSGATNMVATLWSDGAEINLNSFMNADAISAGWILESAFGISDSGSIVGGAYNYKTFSRDAYVLSISAVPEPATYLLLLCGLMLISCSLRYRKNM